MNREDILKLKGVKFKREEICKINELLISHGLANLSGSLNYSSLERTDSSPIYFLGSSPGGDPKVETRTIKEHFNYMINNPIHNEICDGIWMPGGKFKSMGRSVLQKRIQYLLASLLINPRNVFSINLIFKRFKSEDCIEDFNMWAEKCWPLHQYFLKKVDSEFIIVLGNKSFDFVFNKMSNLSKKDELLIEHKQGRYCVHVSGNLCGKRRHLIRIPHLSRFAINNSKYKPIIEWIRSFINNGEKFYPVMG